MPGPRHVDGLTVLSNNLANPQLGDTPRFATASPRHFQRAGGGRGGEQASITRARRDADNTSPMSLRFFFRPGAQQCFALVESTNESLPQANPLRVSG